VPRLLAALRPRMLRLAAEQADGAHTYLVPVEHTRRAREVLGPDRLLAVELAVVVDDDPGRARERAREHLRWYLRVPNYADNLRWLGYGEDDLAGGGSDRVVDDLVAWGDADDVRAKIAAHRQAGADHVALQPLGGEGDPLGVETLGLLAP
jgi:probable F420-dependent oxidoreductase